MNNKKIVGIISSHVENTSDPYDDYYKVVSAYAKKLDTEKVIPIALLVDDDFNFDSFKLCDGFILQGGKKVDRYIYYMIDYAIKNKKPILGICLGAEAIANYSCIRERMEKNHIVNLSYINDIYEQLEKENDGTLLRKLPEGNIHDNNINHKNYCHKVFINKNSIAYDIFKNEIINVPSFHGYDFKHVGKDFNVSGRSEDNVCEIIEYNGNCFVMGVHFHPEIIETEIFDYFIKQL